MITIIGQNKLLSKINSLIDRDQFPRFCIINGIEGSGKKLISEYIANKLNATFVPCSIKIDDIRDITSIAYTLSSPVVYMWADCDKMSINAKNAILKVTEEPPQQAYFIMTTNDINSILNTLISRGIVFNVDNYSNTDINDYINYKQYDISDNIRTILTNICITPKDVQYCMSMDIEAFYKTVNTVATSIGKINLANELKLINQLSTKEDDGKYNPQLFLRIFMMILNELNIKNPNRKISDTIIATSNAIHELNSKGLNKLNILDNWIITSHINMQEV